MALERNYSPEYLDQLLKETEASKLLGVSHRTLQNWRVRGGGPQYKKIAGKSIRYTRRDLLAFIEAGSRRNTSQESAAA
ncbi:MAG: helix-turn-helix domain-containing protein [Rhodospirillaceae bacterium]